MTHERNGYRYWYAPKAKKWIAAKYSPQGKQLTEPFIVKTKPEIIEAIDNAE